MASKIDSQNKRGSLLVAKEPYWEKITTGVYVGYRKLEPGKDGLGTWSGRYRGKGDAKQVYLALGDSVLLPGESISEYDKAKKLITEWADRIANPLPPEPTPDPIKTVSDVCRAYVDSLTAAHRDSTAYDARKRFERLVYGNPIGALDVKKLQTLDVWQWRDSLTAKYKSADKDRLKRAQDSANRNLKTLKAALNYAKKTLKAVSNDDAWKDVEMFDKCARRRDGLLTVDERRALLASMPPELRVFSTALLMTGARPGEIANAKVSDYDRNAGAIWLDGKTGRRKVDLSTAAGAFFAQQSRDRIGNDPMFKNPFGDRWTAPQWGKAFREARDAAGLPDAVLYCFRHTYISESIAQGIDVFTVAKLTGTSVDIIQKNYGALTENIVERLDRVQVM